MASRNERRRQQLIEARYEITNLKLQNAVKDDYIKLLQKLYDECKRRTRTLFCIQTTIFIVYMTISMVVIWGLM